MMLTLVVSSSSPQGLLWVIFICLLTRFYTRPFFFTGLQLQIVCGFTNATYVH